MKKSVKTTIDGFFSKARKNGYRRTSYYEIITQVKEYNPTLFANIFFGCTWLKSSTVVTEKALVLINEKFKYFYFTYQNTEKSFLKF